MNKAIVICVLVAIILNESAGTPLATVRYGEYVKLHCPIHTQGPDFLIQSVTWSKDGQTFYKFDPHRSRFPSTFILYGVEIQDDTFFNGTELIIGPAIRETPGFYRCTAELSNPFLYPGLKMAVNVDTRLSLVKNQNKYKSRRLYN